jgi:hypothetical protein
LILLLIASVVHAEEALRVTAYEVSAVASLPANIPRRVMKQSSGFEVKYVVEGKNITGFNEDSLRIQALKAQGGRDLTKRLSGGWNYEMGNFPKTYEDGRFGVFSVKVDEFRFEDVGKIEMTGTVGVLIGGELITLETKEIDLKADYTEKIGPYVVSKPEESESGFGFFSRGESLGVTVQGDFNKIANIQIVSGGIELDSNGYSQSNGIKDYYFKGEAKKGTIKIQYWKDLKEVQAPFKLAPAGPNSP